MTQPTRHASRRPTVVAAVIFVVVAVVAVVLLYSRQHIGVLLRSGDEISAEFPRQYKLFTDRSEVKMAGVPVGVVTGVEQQERGAVRVDLKVDDGVLDKLGGAPSAAIRPTTLLGGKYYVALTPGGPDKAFTDGTIPQERTSTPVELDKALSTLTPPARDGIRSTVRKLDETLARGGKPALRDLVAEAPDTLRPGAEVFKAVQGSQPKRDLTTLVRGLDSVAGALNEQDGRLDAIVDGLRDTGDALAEQATPVATTVGDLPQTLAATRAGLTDLQGTLRKLIETSPAARRSVRKLDALLDKLDPALVEARPVIRELRPLLSEARPLVDRLVPTADQATGVLNDVRGPVLDRLNGPVTKTVLSPYKGTGPYAGPRPDNPFYEETAYLLSRLNNDAKYTDKNGAMVGLQIGVQATSAIGSPYSLPQLLERLGRIAGGTDGK